MRTKAGGRWKVLKCSGAAYTEGVMKFKDQRVMGRKPFEEDVCTKVRRKWEKVMAPHSSTLAWRIPWTEEPGRLQSMGL